jgi:hypothetical protein
MHPTTDRLPARSPDLARRVRAYVEARDCRHCHGMGFIKRWPCPACQGTRARVSVTPVPITGKEPF